MLLPAAIVGVALTGGLAFHLLVPESTLFESELFDDPAPASFEDALAWRHRVDQTSPFIHRGRSPNDPVVISHPDLTAGAPIAAAPLMIATATGEPNVVRMLLAFGARLELPQNRLAPCLAAELGYDEILGILASAPAALPPVACPPGRDAPAPLLRWLP